MVTWSDWGEPGQGSSSDLDVAVVALQGGGRGEIVTASAGVQNGSQPAREWVDFQARPGFVYAVLIVLPDEVRSGLDVHVTTRLPQPPNDCGQIRQQPVDPTQSIGGPATARSALAVAAWDVHDDDLAAYSSHGPTDDRRLKPEVTAPTAVHTIAYDGPFHGTSAAAPHVAGFAALLQQHARPDSAVQLREYILRETRLLASEPDSRTGFGLIDAAGIVIVPPPEPEPEPEPAPEPDPPTGPEPQKDPLTERLKDILRQQRESATSGS